MLKPDEIQYIELQLKKTISSIYSDHFNYIIGEIDDFEYENPGWTKHCLRETLRDLYYLILAYLEARGLLNFLETFKSKFEITIDDDEKVMNTQIIHPESEPELMILNGFRQFLEPFKFYPHNQVNEKETKKLTSILRNTGFILKNMKARVKNEADIYKQIKWILGLYYPSCRSKNKASFIQEFKSYNPDILIPEIKTAIEYKYINSMADNIDDFLDQVKVDSVNYVEDMRYETFIAVIYIENISMATPESIELAWKSKRFPNNWELVIALNSSTAS